MVNGAFDRWGKVLAEALSWAWQEFATRLLGPLGQLGSRRSGVLTGLDTAGAPGVPGGIGQSWFGLWRHQQREGRACSVVTLAPERVLRRVITLDGIATRNPREAARLEAVSLNPLNPEASVIAIAPIGPGQVELAIAHRADVEAATAHAREQGQAWMVAADFGTDGPRFVFKESMRERAASPWLMATLVVLALTAALFAFEDRVQRDIEALEQTRTELIAQARARRTTPQTGLAAERAQEYSDLAETLSALAQTSDEPFESVRVVQGEVMIERGREVERIPVGPGAEATP